MVTNERGFNLQRKKMEFQRAHKVSDNFYELTKHLKTVTERYPLHCGLSVLHYSKLILMEFVLFLHEFLEKDSFEICYSDTDSMAISMTGSMETLVRPEKRCEWNDAQMRWFVQDHEDARDLRRPGKMKLEWSTKDGALIW